VHTIGEAFALSGALGTVRRMPRTTDLVAVLHNLMPYNTSTGPVLARAILTHGNEEQLETLAGDPGTPVDVLVTLSRHKRAKIRAVVAANPLLPAEERERLAKDKSVTVSRAATRRITPARRQDPVTASQHRVEFFNALAAGEMHKSDLSQLIFSALVLIDQQVIDALRDQPAMPHVQAGPIERLLSQQGDRRIEATKAIAPLLGMEAVRGLLQNRSHEDIHEHIAPLVDCIDPSLLQTWTTSAQWRDRMIAAAHPLQDPQDLTALGGDSSREVAATAATNPNAGVDVLRRYAMNPVANVDLLMTLLGKLEDEGIVDTLLMEGSTSILMAALREQVVTSVARDEQLRIAAYSSNESLRRFVATAHDTSPDLLEVLLQDSNENVREAAMTHPNMPVGALVTMSQTRAIPWNLLVRMSSEDLLDLGTITVLRVLNVGYVRYQDQQLYSTCKERLARVFLDQLTSLNLADPDSIHLIITLGESFKGSLRELMTTVASLRVGS
jgi:hypothetical protein